MEKLEKRIQQNWDDAYKYHDFKSLPWETVEPDKELVLLLRERKIKKCRALDIGCGAGTNSIFLAQNRFDVTAVDISPTAIDIAKKRSKDAEVKIKFFVTNAYSLNLPKNSFDFIFDRGCFHHIPINYRKSYVKQNHRLLIKNGKYYLHAFSDRNNWNQENLFSLGRIKTYFGEYFKIIEAGEIAHTAPHGEKVYLKSALMQKI